MKRLSTLIAWLVLGAALAAQVVIGPSSSTPTSGAGSGSVTSVGVAVPAALLTVSGTPVTASGTITLALGTRAANLVFAGPTSGGVATPTFRALVAADMPAGVGAPTIGDTQVAFGDGANTIGGDSGLTYNKTTDVLTVGQLTVATAGAIIDTGSRYYFRSSNGYDLSIEAVGATVRLSTANALMVLSAAGDLTETGGSIIGRHVTAGTVPVVSNTTANSCGTTTATIAGNDNAGKVTVGATAGTSCTVTFAIAFSNAPSCSVSNETTANLSRATSTVSTVVLAGTFVAGDVLAYSCLGR